MVDNSGNTNASYHLANKVKFHSASEKEQEANYPNPKNKKKLNPSKISHEEHDLNTEFPDGKIPEEKQEKNNSEGNYSVNEINIHPRKKTDETDNTNPKKEKDPNNQAVKVCEIKKRSLDEFKNQVKYQPVKLGNCKEGILPLQERPTQLKNEESKKEPFPSRSKSIQSRSEKSMNESIILLEISNQEKMEEDMKESFNMKNQPEEKEPISNKNPEEHKEFDCEFLQNWIDQKKGHECKFLIVVAMYNEAWEEFDKTLEGIMKDLDAFIDKVGSDGIGVVFIIDGIEVFMNTLMKFDVKVLEDKRKCCFRENFSYFSQFFNIDVINEYFHTKDVLKKDNKNAFDLIKNLCQAEVIQTGQEIAHLFCQKITRDSKNPLNIIFCVKQENKKKLNTHRWFFEGFCVRINPEFVVLLDVGTIPEKGGLTSLYEAMENDTRIAGCCGEIIPADANNCNPVVQTQVVEYKFAHLMDKALESVIGYVSVLPGAFSAYRWAALNDSKILDKYFHSQRPGIVLDLFNANMYLAEDRILCMELMCQKGKKNILRYVKKSIAKTDVPNTINTLMAQRRRWINGSWFSMIYTIKNCNRIDDSDHSYLRKCVFKALMFYYAIVALFNWLLVGAFYLAFAVSIKMNLGEADRNQDKLTKWSEPAIVLYGCLICTIVITSFAVKPVKLEKFYIFISRLFGVYTYVTIFLTVFYLFRNGFNIYDWKSQISAWMIVVLAIMFSFIILLNLKSSIRTVIRGIFWYVFMTGTYVNIFFIYSICNIHDVSWGNRPDKAIEDEKKHANDYKNERTRWVLVWIVFNSSFAYLSGVVIGSGGEWGKGYLIMLGVIVYGIIIIKFIGGVLYVVDEAYCSGCHEDRDSG